VNSRRLISRISTDRLVFLRLNRSTLVLLFGVLDPAYQTCLHDRNDSLRGTDVDSHVSTRERKDNTHHLCLEDARKDRVSFFTCLNVESLDIS